MLGKLPAACVLAVLMTAGSSLAVFEAVNIVAGTAAEAADVAIAAGDTVLAPAGMTTQDVYETVMEPPVSLCETPQACAATDLVQVVVSNAIFLKNSAETVAVGAVQPIASDPAGAPSAVRGTAENARALAYQRADTAWSVAWNGYDTAYAVAALELAALGYAPGVVDCTGALPDAPLEFQACVVAWSNALVEL